MCTLDAIWPLFFFLLRCLQIRLRITYYLLFLRKESEEKENIEKKKKKTTHTHTHTHHSKHKTNTISTAFTIEAVVISEVFTFSVLSQWAENSCGEPSNGIYVVLMLIPTVFSSSTPLLLCNVSVCVYYTHIFCWWWWWWWWWLFQCPSKTQRAVCNEMTMQSVINYKSVYRFDVSFLYVDKYILCIAWRMVFILALVLLFPSAMWPNVDGANGNLGIVIAVLEIANAIEWFEILFAHFIFCLWSNLFLPDREEKNRRARIFLGVFFLLAIQIGGSFELNKKISQIEALLANK